MHISTPTSMIHVEVQYGWDHDHRGRSGMKYSLCFSVIWLIVPDNILTTRKLQDAFSNWRGHGWQDKTRKGKQQQQKNINKNHVRWGDSHTPSSNLKTTWNTQGYHLCCHSLWASLSLISILNGCPLEITENSSESARETSLHRKCFNGTNLANS